MLLSTSHRAITFRTLSHLPRSIDTSTRVQHSIRTMASSAEAPAKQEWLVILPDQEDALQRRMAIRMKHLENVLADGKKGFWLLGGLIVPKGAMLSRPQEPSDTAPPMVGSVMLAYAESREAVLARLKEDVYTTEDVWDWDRVQIWPFRSAIRVGLEGIR